MILLWILGIVTLLFLLLCRTRVRVLASMRERKLSLDLRIGLARAHLYPPPEKKPEKPEKKKRKKKKKPEGEAEPSRSLPVPTLEDVRDALRSLPGPLRRALARIGRGLRVHPLTVSVVFGGWEDPPAAAENYGTASAVVWTFMPLLERWLDIPDPDIRLDVDFTAAETAVEGELGVSARIGTLLGAGLGVGLPVLMWFRRAAGRRRDSGTGNEDTAKRDAGKQDSEKQGAKKEDTEKQDTEKQDTEKQGKDKSKSGKREKKHTKTIEAA